ncbi:MAG: hypothetical protein N3G22_03470 [Candidatus Micrarchaeota archaeon]|nr:hypothetical protein [Candidatus Micrarchaeota archaeon]
MLLFQVAQKEKPARKRIEIDKVVPVIAIPTEKQLREELKKVDKLADEIKLPEKQKEELRKFYKILRTDKKIFQTEEAALEKVRGMLYYERVWSRLRRYNSVIERYDLTAEEMVQLVKTMFRAEKDERLRKGMWIFDCRHGENKELFNYSKEKEPAGYNPLSRFVWLAASLHTALHERGSADHYRLLDLAKQECSPELLGKIKKLRAGNAIYFSYQNADKDNWDE